MISFFKKSAKILAAIAIALVLLVVIAYFRAAPERAGERVLFVGGEIGTMAEPLFAEAILVDKGVVAGVGSEADMRALGGDSVEVVDLGDQTLMPGLIEAHTHPLATAMLGRAIDVSGFTYNSRAEIMDALKKAVSKFHPQPWIVAFG